MDRKNKTFDAVQMVREIRNAHYQQTKDMTIEERITFYRKKARALDQEMNERKGKTPV